MDLSKKHVIGIVGIILIVLGGVFYWNYTQETSKLEEGRNKITSVENTISEIYEMENYSDNLSEIRLKISKAKKDLEKGIQLIKSSDLLTSKRENLAVTMARTYFPMLRMTENFAEAMAHYELAMVSFGYKDWPNVKEEFLISAEYFEKTQTNFLSANEMWNTINIENVPPKFSSFVSNQSSRFEEYDDFLPEFTESVRSFIPLAKGFGSVMEGANHLKREEYSLAKSSFENSLEPLSEAKQKFDNLKDSESMKVRNLAIKFSSNVGKLEEGINYYIEGCRHALDGDMAPAKTDFNNGNDILQNISWE